METQFNKLSKKAISCMRLSSIITSIIILGVLTAAWIILKVMKINIPLSATIALAVTYALAIAYIILAPPVRWRRYLYHIDNDSVIVVEGLFFITKDMAPIERIHQIAVKSGPIDRMYGLSKVICTTAGGQITVNFLETNLAEEIANNLQHRINGIIAEQEAAANA